MRNLYFIDRFPFNKDFYIRNDFESLEKRGYLVQFIDASNLFKRRDISNTISEDLKKYVIRLTTIKEAKAFFKNIKNNSVVISTVPFVGNTSWLYLYIFQYKVPYIIIEHSSFPVFTKQKSIQSQRINQQRAAKNLKFRKIIRKPAENFRFFKALCIKKEPLALISSKLGKSIFKKLTTTKTEVHHVATPDYLKSLNPSKPINIQEKYAVFIDQYFIHHPDFKSNYIVHHFTAEEYYSRLNERLKEFESNSKLKVIIASHPRRQFEHKEDFAPSFDQHINKTPQLVENASVVLMHFSTAINFAVLYKKPIILLNSELFNTSNISTYISGFRKYFDAPEITIDKPLLSKDTFDKIFVNENRYSEYKNNYLKHPKSDERKLDEYLNKIIEEKLVS